MSNGNDQPNFPPPPNTPPENNYSGTGSETSADDQSDSPSRADRSENTPQDDTSRTEPDSASESAESGASSAPSYPKDQAPPLQADNRDGKRADPSGQNSQAGNPSQQNPNQNQQPRPEVQSGDSHRNFPQQGGSGQQNPNQPPQNPNQPPQNPNQPPQNPNPVPSNEAPYYSGGQHSGNQQWGGQYQGGSPYQSGPGQNGAYPPAQGQYGSGQPGQGQYGSGPAQTGPGQYGQYQTGSGPDAHRTGSGPGQSQAIPQPAPAPGFAGSTAAATRADARPEKKKSKMPLFITLGAVALVIILVLVGFLVVNSVNKNNYGPDKVAEDYVSALSKGDFAAAEKIAPSPRPEGTNLDLLSKNFTDNSSTKVENAKVESSNVDGDNGKVVVSYELDGSAFNVELTAKKDGKQDLFFDKWKLTGPALNVISLDVPAADGMTVNGQDYKAQSGTTSFAVYPGNYDFSIPASKWVSKASDTAAVNFPQAFGPGGKPNTDQVSPMTLNLDLSPTGEFQKEVQKQVEAELKKCFDNKDIKPKCKFIKFDPTEIPVGGTDKKLDDLAKKNTAKWDMKDMPKVKADFGAGDTSTGSFFTEKPGKFNFTVQGKKSGSSYFSNGNTLSVSGSVKIDGDKLKVEFFDF